VHFSGLTLLIGCAWHWNIGTLRTQVILHASFVENPYRSYVRQFLRGVKKPSFVPHHYNSTKPDSRFKQIKYNLGSAGKIQQYYPGRNLIRAGKYSHADAVATTLKLVRDAGGNTEHYLRTVLMLNCVLLDGTIGFYNGPMK